MQLHGRHGIHDPALEQAPAAAPEVRLGVVLTAAAIGIGAIGLILVAADSALAVYMPALAVFGIGYGLCWALTSVGTQTVVPIKQAGEASGVTLAIVIGMAGLGVAIAAALIEALSTGGTGEGAAIEDILRTLAIASVVLAAPLALLGRKPAASDG